MAGQAGTERNRSRRPTSPVRRKIYSRTLPALDLSAIRIFIVDDNEFAVALVKSLLTVMHVSDVHSCSSAERAAAEIGQVKPDIVLVDLEMPGTHGLDLIRAIRTGDLDIRQDVAILAVSAYADREQVTKVSNAGANWMLVKPLSFRSLYEGLVRVILDDRPFVRADGYIGPCRRVHMTPPEQLVTRRRKTDSGDS